MSNVQIDTTRLAGVKSLARGAHDKRDGYEEGVQNAAVRAGLDGEYRVSPDPERHCPDVATMLDRIGERVEALENTRPASQAPAASAGDADYARRIANEAVGMPANWPPAATLAPTAQAQPAAREEIARLITQHVEIGGTEHDAGIDLFVDPASVERATDAILAARPVADGVAGEARDEEAEDLFQSERISAAQAVYDEAMADYDPTVPDHEVHSFDAMKAAIGCADAFGGPLA